MAKPVKVAVVAETRKAKAAFQNLERELGLDRLKAGLGSLAKEAAAVTAGIVTAAGAAAASAISMASEYEQSAGAIEAIFKDQAGVMANYSKAAATAVGLTKTEYNQLASVLGSQLKNGGTAMDQLGDKTNSLISLGADLSAMFGGTTADAVNALSSALKGERNPIERYGVTLKQATIDAKAAELGFSKVGGALTSEAQQAATLALIMEQTADAHGRFAAEGDTLAGMWQRAKAQMQNWMTDLGVKLMPLVKRAGQWLGERLPAMLAVASTFFDTRLIPAVRRFAEYMTTHVWPTIRNVASSLYTTLMPHVKRLAAFVTGTVIPAARTLVSWAIRHRNMILVVAGAVGAGVLAWRAYQKALAIHSAIKRTATAIKGVNAALRANPVGLVIAAIAALAAGLVLLYKRHEGFRNFVKSAWAKIKEYVAAFLAWWNGTARPAFAAFWAAIRPYLVAFGNFVTQTLWPAIKSAWASISAATGAFVAWFRAKVAPPLSTAFNAIRAAFAAAWGWIKNTAIPSLVSTWNTLKPVFSLLGTFLTRVLWPIIKNVFMSVKNVISTAFEFVRTRVIPPLLATWETVKPAFKAVGDFVTQTLWPAFKTAWDGISSTVSTVVAFVKDTLIPWFVGAFNTVKDIPNRVWTWMKDTYNNIVSALTDAINWVISFPGKVIDALAQMGQMLWDWAKAAFDRVKDGFTNAWNTVNSWLGGRPQAILDSLGDLGSLLWQAGKDVFYGFWEGMKSVWYDIKNWLTGTVSDQIPQLKGPPARDRKLLVGNGRLIMQGLHAGLTEEWTRVERFLSSRGAHISDIDYGSLNARLAPVASGNAQPRLVTYNINVSTLDGNPAVGRRILSAIREYERVSGQR